MSVQVNVRQSVPEPASDFTMALLQCSGEQLGAWLKGGTTPDKVGPLAPFSDWLAEIGHPSASFSV